MKKEFTMIEVYNKPNKPQTISLCAMAICTIAQVVFLCYDAEHTEQLRHNPLLVIASLLPLLLSIVAFLVVSYYFPNKDTMTTGIKRDFAFLTDYGYQFESSLCMKHNDMQFLYSGEKLPSTSIFWNNKERNIMLTLWARAKDDKEPYEYTWINIRYIGKEWYGIDWQSDEFCELTFEQYCEKVFSALGIKRCDENDEKI